MSEEREETYDEYCERRDQHEQSLIRTGSLKLPLHIDQLKGGLDTAGTLHIPFTNTFGSMGREGELKDMAEIVRRVNVHDDLLTSLRDCQKVLAALTGPATAGIAAIYSQSLAAEANARAAIAKATAS